MSHELRHSLAEAIAREGPPSSDYDLNPDVVLPTDRKLREAAVLVPIMAKSSGSVVVLTKRTSTLKHHPGQVSFPGGKVDDDDGDTVSAALREAEEEIGLPRRAVDVVGSLPFHETVTGFRVTPVIGLVEPFTPEAERNEVAEVFEVPLEHVLDASNYQIQSRRWRGTRRSYFTVPYGPYYIWGATARMLRAFADRMNDSDRR